MKIKSHKEARLDWTNLDNTNKKKPDQKDHEYKITSDKKEKKEKKANKEFLYKASKTPKSSKSSKSFKSFKRSSESPRFSTETPKFCKSTKSPKCSTQGRKEISVDVNVIPEVIYKQIEKNNRTTFEIELDVNSSPNCRIIKKEVLDPSCGKTITKYVLLVDSDVKVQCAPKITQIGGKPSATYEMDVTVDTDTIVVNDC